jgi:CheY-like chemotaxis protein
MRYKTLPLGTPALVIESNIEQSSVYLDALREAGYSPIAVHTEVDALRQMRLFKPRLILLNASLPNFPDLIGLIRAHEYVYEQRAWIFLLADSQIVTNTIDLVDLVVMLPVRFEQMRDLALRFRRCIV